MSPSVSRVNWVIFLFCAAFCSTATPWFARVWQVDDGLPGDNVTGVVQARDGYLWLATQSGLARFDGVRLQRIPMPEGRPFPIIRAMLLDGEQRLWLAGENGLAICYSAESTRLFTATNGLSRFQPVEMALDGDGAVWITYVDGSVCRIAGETVTRFGKEHGLPASGVCSVTSDSRGRLWYAKAGQVGMFRDERFVALSKLDERYIQVQGARDGGIWVCAGDRLFKYDEGREPVELGRIIVDSGLVRPAAIYEDEAGAVWVGTTTLGLFRHDGTNFNRIQTSHGRIRTIAQDREGSIWVGTDGGGLNRLRQQVVDVQGKEAGVPFDTVRSVCEGPDGALWVVVQNGEVAMHDGSEWKTISATPAWPGGQATCVARDAAGVVWVGTYSRGVYRWRDGEFTAVRRADGLASSSIRSMLADSRGNLWIAFTASNALQRFRDGEFESFPLPAGSRAVRAMTEAPDGSIWMANLDAQLLRVKDGEVIDETRRTDEPRRPIRCLAATPDGSLWIGYSSGGIGRLTNGEFTRIGTEHGLQDEAICSLMPDERGWMWIGSDHGIFRVSQKELTDVADGRAAMVRSVGYGEDDGLPSLQAYYGYSPGAARCRDGRILIPTHSGLAIVHPGRVQANPVPPPVIIETIMVDNHVIAPGRGDDALVLPPGHRKLEVTFTAPTFVKPRRVSFRYRLDGWDDEWVEAGEQRHAVYSRLPAGKYEFRIAAGNNAGQWNEPVSFGFTVEPFFWQTWWFRLASILAFTGVVIAVARYLSFRRLRVKLRRLESENALQLERARIAQDIHDDLGARMTQISLLAEMTQQALREPDKAAEHVAQIAGMSRQGIKSLDEIVWAVNPGNDTVQDLLDYAGQYAVDFLQAAGIRCRVDFPAASQPGDLSADVRHGLFLAVKEALHNVVKHAGATEVRLRVSVDGQTLRWSIEDNGRGFEQPPSDALADGLRNMRQRLSALGGTCAVNSQAGNGTRIEFAVPWHGGNEAKQA